jgi:hypothetical protein
VVQAGERILFAVDNGKVTAHIQIQYAGDAKEFGWLIPLPSVPIVKVGSEELFTLRTQPTYQANTAFTGEGCPPSQPSLSLGCGSQPAALARSEAFGADAGVQALLPSPVVVQATGGAEAQETVNDSRSDERRSRCMS